MNHVLSIGKSSLNCHQTPSGTNCSRNTNVRTRNTINIKMCSFSRHLRTQRSLVGTQLMSSALVVGLSQIR